MADRDKVAEVAAPEAAPRRHEALADMVNAANALQAIQAQAALEAMKLPDKRLDDASPEGGASPYTLRHVGPGPDDFVKVDSEGREVK